MLVINTTPKTIKLDMQTAIDELVKAYPEYETQVREMINKLVTESKKQKTESTPKLNEMDRKEVPENVLSPSAPEFHPLPTPPPTQPPASSALPPTSPPKTQQPTSIDTQQSLFDPTQKESSFTPAFIDSSVHMDCSENTNPVSDLKRKLSIDDSDDEELIEKRNRYEYSPEDIRALVNAYQETKKHNKVLEEAYRDEQKERLRVSNECDTVKQEMREFKDSMKRELHESIQQGISTGMEKLSLDLSVGLTQIKNSLKNSDQTTQNSSNENKSHSKSPIDKTKKTYQHPPSSNISKTQHTAPKTTSKTLHTHPKNTDRTHSTKPNQYEGMR